MDLSIMGKLQDKLAEWASNNVIPVLVLGYLVFTFFLGFLRKREPFPESGGRVESIHSEAEWRDLIKSDTPTLIDYYATWCPPCRRAAPIFGRMSMKYPDVTFIKVDVDKVNAVAGLAEVGAMPTFQLWRRGEKVETVVGWDEKKVEGMLRRNGMSEGNNTAKSD
jgi:thioredoxin 1